MKIFLSILPIALLVAYSQLMVKWRTLRVDLTDHESAVSWSRVVHYLSDPLLLSAYGTALLASFLWLIVVARLPLVTAFPVYIGITFVLVSVGSWMFLSESISATKLLAAALILAGITLGVRS